MNSASPSCLGICILAAVVAAIAVTLLMIGAHRQRRQACGAPRMYGSGSASPVMTPIDRFRIRGPSDSFFTPLYPLFVTDPDGNKWYLVINGDGTTGIGSTYVDDIQTISVGSNTSQGPKRIALPSALVGHHIDGTPSNTQRRGWTDRFTIAERGGGYIVVARADRPDPGTWGQNLQLRATHDAWKTQFHVTPVGRSESFHLWVQEPGTDTRHYLSITGDGVSSTTNTPGVTETIEIESAPGVDGVWLGARDQENRLHVLKMCPPGGACGQEVGLSSEEQVDQGDLVLRGVIDQTEQTNPAWRNMIQFTHGLGNYQDGHMLGMSVNDDRDWTYTDTNQLQWQGMCLSALTDDITVLQSCDEAARNPQQQWTMSGDPNGERTFTSHATETCLATDATMQPCDSQNVGWNVDVAPPPAAAPPVVAAAPLPDGGDLVLSGGEGIQLSIRDSTTNFKCLEALEREEGGDVQMRDCNVFVENQRWIKTTSQATQFKLANSNLCLDAAQRNTRGGNVHLWTCNTANVNQQWNPHGSDGKGLQADTAKCLDANLNGNNVHMWDCSGSNANQRCASEK